MVVASNYLIHWCPLLILPSILPSIRDSSSESAVHIRWPKYWSFSFSISPFSEYSGLISIKIDWFDLLACPRDSQESSPAPQFQGINSFVLCLFYGPDLTTMCGHWEDHIFDYMDLCQQSSLCFSTHCLGLSFAFLPRSNRLLISWLQSPSAVILEPKKRKYLTTSTFPPSICHDAMILVFF